MSHRVSVIMPLYNAAGFLGKSVGSLIGQTYRNLEILLIDDGSQDESADICRRFAEEDPRIVFLRQPNQGVSAARNRGLEMMTGEFLAFLDSDDWFEPDAIEKMLAALCGNDADVVFCNSVNERDGKSEPRAEGLDTGVADGNELVRQMLCYLDEDGKPRGYFLSLWNKLFRTSALRAAPGGIRPFQASLHILEDGVWLMEHAPYLKKGVLVDAGYHHRLLHDQSTMGNQEREIVRQREYLRAYSMILDMVGAMNDPQTLTMCKNAYFRSMRELVRIVYRTEDAGSEDLLPAIQGLNKTFGAEFVAGELLEARKVLTSQTFQCGREINELTEKSALARFLYKCLRFLANPRFKLRRFWRRWSRRAYWAVRGPLGSAYGKLKQKAARRGREGREDEPR